MSFWAKIRKWRTLGTLALVTLILGQLVGDFPIPLPQLFTGHQASAVVGTLLPLTVSVFFMSSVSAGDGILEYVATRNVFIADWGLLVFVGLLSCAAAAILSHLSGGWVTVGVARNIILYTALSYVALLIGAGKVASSIPAFWVVAATIAGGDPAGGVAWWAIPLQPANAVVAWTVTLALLAGLSIPAALRNTREPSKH